MIAVSAHAATAGYDAVIVGSGPNGLAAAIRLAQEGWHVLVVEANDELGGGVRSHAPFGDQSIVDHCSAIHPMALASPFFRSLGLERYGLSWVHSPLAIAHPLDDGKAVGLWRDLDVTADHLGLDGAAYRALVQPLLRRGENALSDVLRPLRWPRHPMGMLRFALRARRSVAGIAARFQGAAARALWAGIGAHAILPFPAPLSAAPGIALAVAAHTVGWPLPQGGAQSLTRALAAHLASLGGEVRTGCRVESMRQLPRARVVLCDTSPHTLLRVGDGMLSQRDGMRLAKYRYGPGVYKVDWLLDGAIPWSNALCAQAATVHVGGTYEDIVAAEASVGAGEVSQRPFVLLGQQSLFDASRASAGRQVVWGYCHVPHASREEMTERMERQVERFAPGFCDRIIARHVQTPLQMEADNANYVGGDIACGAMDWRQLLTRPVARRTPYATSHPRLWICSAATPPGPGVHGMCGVLAAEAVLARSAYL